MPDAVGTRAKWGVIIPSTNTVVEHDFYAIKPDGITFHAGRMYLETQDLSSDDAFEALLVQIRGSIKTAIRDVVTCEPDYLVMGMSAETFWGGKAGGVQFIKEVEEASGLQVATARRPARQRLQPSASSASQSSRPINRSETSRFVVSSKNLASRSFGSTAFAAHPRPQSQP